MKTQFKELMRGLDDVESFLSGETEGFKIDKNPAAVLTALQPAAFAAAAGSSKVHHVRHKTIKKKTSRSGQYVARASQHGDRSHR